VRLQALDEDDVAVARTADAFVADGFARDFHSVARRWVEASGKSGL
jgi:hypothetical protein